MTQRISLTVAAIIERDNRFLVVEEVAGGEHVINQPAGHVENGENIVAAVIRETQEETAWQFKPEAITGIYLWQHPVKKKSFLRVAFCGSCAAHAPEQSLDEGILRTHWLTRDELLTRSEQLRSPMVVRCIDDYLAGNRLPCDNIQQLPLENLLELAATV
ncbi:MAG: NUDIX hydrolase [Gammaproteobacteria bacterium]|nr:NUDIX hydrolase [Gammaproteobacteria bacterium]